MCFLHLQHISVWTTHNTSAQQPHVTSGYYSRLNRSKGGLQLKHNNIKEVGGDVLKLGTQKIPWGYMASQPCLQGEDQIAEKTLKGGGTAGKRKERCCLSTLAEVGCQWGQERKVDKEEMLGQIVKFFYILPTLFPYRKSKLFSPKKASPQQTHSLQSFHQLPVTQLTTDFQLRQLESKSCRPSQREARVGFVVSEEMPAGAGFWPLAQHG